MIRLCESNNSINEWKEIAVDQLVNSGLFDKETSYEIIDEIIDNIPAFDNAPDWLYETLQGIVRILLEENKTSEQVLSNVKFVGRNYDKYLETLKKYAETVDKQSLENEIYNFVNRYSFGDILKFGQDGSVPAYHHGMRKTLNQDMYDQAHPKKKYEYCIQANGNFYFHTNYDNEEDAFYRFIKLFERVGINADDVDFEITDVTEKEDGSREW